MQRLSKMDTFTLLWLACLSLMLVFSAYFLLTRRPVSGRKGSKIVRPIQEILQKPDQIRVNLHHLQAPSVSGYPLKLLNHLYYTPLGKLLAENVKARSNLDLFTGLRLPETPTLDPSPWPTPPPTSDFLGNHDTLLALIQQSSGQGVSVLPQRDGFRFNSVAHFYAAYTSGQCSPIDVARTVIAAVEHSYNAVPPLRAIVDFSPRAILAMAEASAARWRKGSPLSFLDGVPVAVNCWPEDYPCRLETSFVPIVASQLSGPSEMRTLSEAGAVFIGITNMPELGCSSIGSNVNDLHQQPRNPYNTAYFPGGSSSGAGASVAAGLCPVAIGGDGGGSGRVPASVCGVCGLKITQNLLCGTGSYGSLMSFSTVSPICSSVLDTAIVMDVLCNFNRDKTSAMPLSLKGLGETSLTGLTVGVYWEWFELADSEIVTVSRQAVDHIQALGAEVKEVKIPEIEEIRVAHVITAITELAGILSPDVDKHFSDIGPEALLTVALGLQFSAMESINAMKQRTRAMAALTAIFKEVDLIATPTTGCITPQITPDYYPYGKVDAERIGALEIFTYLANFVGIPAITVPVGTMTEGLPVGLQLMAPWHQEQLLLKAAWTMEASGRFPSQRPAVWYDLSS